MPGHMDDGAKKQYSRDKSKGLAPVWRTDPHFYDKPQFPYPDGIGESFPLLLL